MPRSDEFARLRYGKSGRKVARQTLNVRIARPILGSRSSNPTLASVYTQEHVKDDHSQQ